ncbi:hypothetical protein [Butyrivibrio sp. YAB3001]|uniref:hypothetical protein n=1 Tax=Butyrivibrio sp. YAB3001 TaxID=1520812 RepID=UPI0008F6317A|nr:hypothetical protein [Butyrivibrio sp. YAB3001]SFC75127.1 hypothetical protein SAMN02910398_03070 [Butyrivibrio sp. YAB3001]
MTSENWEKLSLKEQMSNIHGEVRRAIRARNNYRNSISKENHTDSYINKIHSLVILTCNDPKNERRKKELLDEENEIIRWTKGEVDDDYIEHYWKQYTDAIS